VKNDTVRSKQQQYDNLSVVTQQMLTTEMTNHRPVSKLTSI